MDEFWSMDSESEARTVDVHINRLRERFKDNKDFSIVTVRGLGYKAIKHAKRGERNGIPDKTRNDDSWLD